MIGLKIKYKYLLDLKKYVLYSNQLLEKYKEIREFQLICNFTVE